MFTYIIAICVSIDSLLAGVFLGVRKIRLSTNMYLVASALFMFFSIFGYLFGNFTVQSFQNFEIASTIISYISNLILFLLGAFYIYKDFKERKTQKNECLGQIDLDLDNSGSIDIFEVLLLAIILSIDTVIAIISLTILDNISMFSALIFGIIQSIFILGGIRGGKFLLHNGNKLSKKLSILKSSPGFLLIFATIFRIIFE